MTVVPRYFSIPDDSFFLFGPRGTGKSTWLREHFSQALWVDLLDREIYQRYSARPSRLRELVGGDVEGRPVVLDEIQKVPELLDVVHQLMTDDRHRRFILTGSSSRKLKRAGVDLLAGRAVNTTMHPFMAAELGDGFDLELALRHGLLPVVVTAPEPRQTLGAYVGLYLEEEVKTEAMVRNVGGFSRFLEAMTFSHGAMLNSSAVARECQVARATVEGYQSVLEDLLLGFRLPVFARRAKRHLVQHPKFYYFDTGVFHSLRPRGPLDSPAEISGAALEGLVAQHLGAWIAYGDRQHTLHYWRTRSGTEVDFVIYGPAYFLAIEVKNGRNVHRRDVRGLRTFREDYPEADVCLLYRGTERLKVNDVLCLPCEAFLRGLVPGQPPWLQ